MRWIGDRESENIEDRRRVGGGLPVGIGGMGAIASVKAPEITAGSRSRWPLWSMPLAGSAASPVPTRRTGSRPSWDPRAPRRFGQDIQQQCRHDLFAANQLAPGRSGARLGFHSLDALANAYGIAVAGDMLVTSVLVATAARGVWDWPLHLLVPVACLFLALDLTFVSADLHKIPDGGWFPLMVGAASLSLMLI